MLRVLSAPSLKLELTTGLPESGKHTAVIDLARPSKACATVSWEWTPFVWPSYIGTRRANSQLASRSLEDGHKPGLYPAKILSTGIIGLTLPSRLHVWTSLVRPWAA